MNYSETDQMGFVYHANYLVWMDMARTEHLRERGATYKALEQQGTFLTVTDVDTVLLSRLPSFTLKLMLRAVGFGLFELLTYVTLRRTVW